MNYSYMNIFYKVAVIGNISKAAKELSVSQPAISRVIGEMESGYGTKLFIRSKSGVSLTKEGQNLFSLIEGPYRELGKIENFIDTPGSLDQTSVDVGATATAMDAFLLPRLDLYRSQLPNVNFNFHTDSSQNLIDMVLDGSIDLALVTTPYLKNKELEIQTISNFTNILIAPMKYRNELSGPVSIKDLTGYPFILLNKKMQFRSHVDKYFADNKVMISPSYEVDSSGALIPFVLNGCGLTFVPEETVRQEIAEGKCFKVDLIEQMPARQITFIIKKSKSHSPVIEKIHRMVMNNEIK